MGCFYQSRTYLTNGLHLSLCTAKTKYQDFKVGGKRFYAMVSPEGQERWAIQEYTSITPKTNFKMYNAFADKDENPELPGSEWDHTFSEENGITKVSITIYNESLERLERILDGFTQGMKMSLRIWKICWQLYLKNDLRFQKL